MQPRPTLVQEHGVGLFRVLDYSGSFRAGSKRLAHLEPFRLSAGKCLKKNERRGEGLCPVFQNSASDITKLLPKNKTLSLSPVAPSTQPSSPPL